MIKTKETDALLKQCKIKGRNPDPWKLCRKLERERDEARADCERINRLLRHETALGQGEIDHWAALEAERDEARAERDEWIARFRADEQLIKEAMPFHPENPEP